MSNNGIPQFIVDMDDGKLKRFTEEALKNVESLVADKQKIVEECAMKSEVFYQACVEMSKRGLARDPQVLS